MMTLKMFMSDKRKKKKKKKENSEATSTCGQLLKSETEKTVKNVAK